MVLGMMNVLTTNCDSWSDLDPLFFESASNVDLVNDLEESNLVVDGVEKSSRPLVLVCEAENETDLVNDLYFSFFCGMDICRLWNAVLDLYLYHLVNRSVGLCLLA